MEAAFKPSGKSFRTVDSGAEKPIAVPIIDAASGGVGRLVLQPPFEQVRRVKSPMHLPFGRKRRLEDQAPYRFP